MNGGIWATTTGWSNWTAQVTLSPGTNSFGAYAVDAAGNHSFTNHQNIVFVASPAPARVQITAVKMLNDPERHFGMSFSGPAGRTVVVEASTNMVDWVPVQTNTLPAIPVQFTDPDAASLSLKFYRLRSTH